MAAATSDLSAVSRPDSGFLDAMAALAGGVCVVTALTSEGHPVGFTDRAAVGCAHRGLPLRTCHR
ncbi:hypothetical protein ABZ372_53515, partial [Streptomyces sp. NPDC005921]